MVVLLTSFQSLSIHFKWVGSKAHRWFRPSCSEVSLRRVPSRHGTLASDAFGLETSMISGAIATLPGDKWQGERTGLQRMHRDGYLVNICKRKGEFTPCSFSSSNRGQRSRGLEIPHSWTMAISMGNRHDENGEFWGASLERPSMEDREIDDRSGVQVGFSNTKQFPQNFGLC